MVEGRTFAIYTDDKPLTSAFSTRQDICSPRQFRYLDFISQFSSNICYVSGKENTVAEASSRKEEVKVSPLEYQSLARAQEIDVELHELLQSGSTLKLEKVRLLKTISSILLYCDVAIPVSRPFTTIYH